MIPTHNSGYDRHSVCWVHHQHSVAVLEGTVKDDGWFAYVCAFDEGDSFEDETTWEKVNPNIDVSVTRAYYREQVAEALSMPSKLNIVLRLLFFVAGLPRRYGSFSFRIDYRNIYCISRDRNYFACVVSIAQNSKFYLRSLWTSY